MDAAVAGVLIIEASWLVSASVIFLCFSWYSRTKVLKELLRTADAPTVGEPSTRQG